MIKTSTSRKSRKPSMLDAHASSDSVSLRMRQLEQYLALSLAGLTAWIGIVSPDHSTWIVWGGAGLAVGVYAWCRLFPARKPALLLVRSALLLTMAALIQLQQGAAGHFFFWTATLAAGYTLLLPRRWAAVVIVMAVIQFVGISLQARPSSWSPWLVQLGMLVAALALATRFAWSIQRTDQELEASFRDRETGLYNVTGLMAHGEQLMAACQRNKEPISLSVLQSPNIREVSDILGREAVRQLLADAVKGLLASAKLSGLGLAARTDSGEFVLLLPGVDVERAKALVRKELGSPPRLVLNVRDREAIVFLDSAALAASPQHNTPESLYESVRSLLERKREKLSQRMSSSQAFASSQASDAADEAQIKAKAEADAAVAPKSRWRPTKPKPESAPASQGVDSSLMSRLEPNLTLPMPLKRQP